MWPGFDSRPMHILWGGCTLCGVWRWEDLICWGTTLLTLAKESAPQARTHSPGRAFWGKGRQAFWSQVSMHPPTADHLKHRWSSGRIHRCHRCDPGSIPGRCTFSGADARSVVCVDGKTPYGVPPPTRLRVRAPGTHTLARACILGEGRQAFSVTSVDVPTSCRPSQASVV